jgi:hypothetical protein
VATTCSIWSRGSRNTRTHRYQSRSRQGAAQRCMFTFYAHAYDFLACRCRSMQVHAGVPSTFAYRYPLPSTCARAPYLHISTCALSVREYLYTLYLPYLCRCIIVYPSVMLQIVIQRAGRRYEPYRLPKMASTTTVKLGDGTYCSHHLPTYMHRHTCPCLFLGLGIGLPPPIGAYRCASL